MTFNPILYVVGLVMEAPLYHLLLEALLVLWILQLLFSKSYYIKKKSKLTREEEDELIREWTPLPLATPINETLEDNEIPAEPENIVESPGLRTIKVNGTEKLNLVTTSFYGMNGNKECVDAALAAIDKFGVGACGPRAFYGTITIHLDFEKRVSEFMKCETCVMYSYGFSTISSAINCYCKRSDKIFCDNAANMAIQKGIHASRSNVSYFRHNNMEHLIQLLEEHKQWEKKNSRQAKVTKKFLIVEGLYNYYGDICPLPKLIELKYKYALRLIIDDSFSFGVLGKSGRGTADYFGCDSLDIDVVAVAMDHALGSNGGFSYGTQYMIEMQRLFGLGYCFSAALPPYLTAGAMQALNIIDSQPDMIEKLKSYSNYVHDKLSSIDTIRLSSHPDSPISHIRLATSTGVRGEDHIILKKIVDKINSRGVAVTMATYVKGLERDIPDPSIRLSINTGLEMSDLDMAISVITIAIQEVICEDDDEAKD